MKAIFRHKSEKKKMWENEEITENECDEMSQRYLSGNRENIETI